MGEFMTGAAAREQFDALADQVDAAYAQMRQLCSTEVGNAYRTRFAERLETQARANRGLMYRFFGQIADPPDEARMAPRMVN
ncbi:HNH nuclease, partial [Mycobacterium sp. NPDC048908]